MDAAQIRRCVDSCITERISFEKATIYYLLDALEQARKDLTEWKNRELCALSVIKTAEAQARSGAEGRQKRAARALLVDVLGYISDEALIRDRIEAMLEGEMSELNTSVNKEEKV